jgi:hypothetical protein
MENKNIKDYLHLYFGCEAIDQEGWKTKVEWSDLGYPENIQNLLLRPLHEMTESDGMKIFGSKKKYLFYRKEKEQNPGDLFLFTPNEIDKLLKEGFDLFNLIESGLAIDKTKLTDHGN